ncbi:hypothetical protein HGRIS_005139 [Hohenbuehelia grisea]|uniref:C2H2-type domain-containing protein n=1 Tax=Hohenbuehelia grisea TaxID=104357 RepID=A0ABR3JFQ4_9AGAR
MPKPSRPQIADETHGLFCSGCGAQFDTLQAREDHWTGGDFDCFKKERRDSRTWLICPFESFANVTCSHTVLRSQSTNLLEHARVHTGHYKYFCTCGYKTPNKSGFYRHQRKCKSAEAPVVPQGIQANPSSTSSTSTSSSSTPEPQFSPPAHSSPASVQSFPEVGHPPLGNDLTVNELGLVPALPTHSSVLPLMTNPHHAIGQHGPYSSVPHHDMHAFPTSSYGTATHSSVLASSSAGFAQYPPHPTSGWPLPNLAPPSQAPHTWAGNVPMMPAMPSMIASPAPPFAPYTGSQTNYTAPSYVGHGQKMPVAQGAPYPTYPLNAWAGIAEMPAMNAIVLPVVPPVPQVDPVPGLLAEYETLKAMAMEMGFTDFPDADADADVDMEVAPPQYPIGSFLHMLNTDVDELSNNFF